MDFVSKNAYDYAKNVYEGEYYYIVEFENRVDKYCLLSKDSKTYMLSGFFTKDCQQYKSWPDEMVEIIDGFYMFRQYMHDDNGLAMIKMNYWINSRTQYCRNNKINMLLDL